MNSTATAARLSSTSLGFKARWIAGHWRPYRRRLVLLVILSVLSAAIAVIYPYLWKRIFDGLAEEMTTAYLGQQVLLVLALGAVHFLVYRTLQTARAVSNLRLEYSARTRAYEHMSRLGPDFYGAYRTGDLVTRLTDDISEKLAWFMCSGLFRFFEALLLVAFGIGMMLWISPTLTLYAASPLPILVVMFVISARALHSRYSAVQESISELNASLENGLSGIRVVKAFTAENQQQEIIGAAIEKQRLAEIRAVRWQTVIDMLYGEVWKVAIVAVLLVGGQMAISGQATLGDIVAFDAYVLMLVWPMFDIGQFLVRGKLSAVVIDRLHAIESSPPQPACESDWTLPPARPPWDELPADHAAVETRREPRAVQFESVGYRFPAASDFALYEVSFAAEPGALTALVGEVGAGKSVALSLVPRLTDPQVGQVAIGGRAAGDWDLVELRQGIGYVTQEALLLSGTIAENIRFGRGWLSDDDIAQAAAIAQLDADLARMGNGLETLIGARGIRLSGGQKQRVALARAIAGRPPILLLDDVTAALDAETEDAVWRGLFEAAPECTTLLVTHRPATLRRCRQIVVFDRGRVVETGRFEELEHAGTLFHKLYAQWQLREDLEA